MLGESSGIGNACLQDRFLDEAIPALRAISILLCGLKAFALAFPPNLANSVIFI